MGTHKPSRKSAWRARQYFKSFVTTASGSTNTAVLPPTILTIPEIKLLEKGFKFIPFGTYIQKHFDMDITSLQHNLINHCLPYRYDIPKTVLSTHTIDESSLSSTASDAINQFVNNIATSFNFNGPSLVKVEDKGHYWRNCAIVKTLESLRVTRVTP